MDRQQAAEVLRLYQYGDNEIPRHSFDLNDETVEAILEAMEHSAPEWISVEERLPETRNSILGQRSNKVIVAFQFNDGTQGTDTAHTLNGDWVFEDRIVVVNRTVTHWMRLPSPPEVDDHG